MLLCKTVQVNDSTPTLLLDGSGLGDYIIHLRVVQMVNIGDSTVSLSDGLSLYPMTTNAELFTARLHGDSLYAVAQSGTAYVGVLAYSA